MNLTELKNKKIGFISLGCDKNRVDLEEIISYIKQAGFQITNNQNEAKIIIINTCAFLEISRKESVDEIKQTAKLKNGNLEKIIVTGCLTKYDITKIRDTLTDVDLFVKIENNQKIVDEIMKLYDVQNETVNVEYNRILTTPKHYAYLKIADGCNNFCSYCTIPYIRGRYKSVPIQDLKKQAEALVNNGVTELILVAQDVTKYGKDLYDSYKLVELIQELSAIKKLKWIRLLYCYPELINEALIDEMATNKKVCHYIDMPLQHVNNEILKAMHRRNTKEATISLIDRLRKKMPDIAIRTTFIVGFSGETKKQFKELCDFIIEQKLTHVRFFAYSKEKGTPAGLMKKQVFNFVKKHRVNVAGKLQYKVVEELGEKLIGQTLDCVVDAVGSDYSILRSEYQNPIVDSVIYVGNTNLVEGKYYKVKIINKLNYDLEGEILK